MSVLNHTPAPWTDGHNVSHEVAVRAEAGMNGGFSVATFYGPDARDNARLTAGAPDLLTAARAALATLDAESIRGVAVDALRTAIAQAEGSPS